MKMKITKRKYSSPLNSGVIWFMPTMTYILLSINGAIRPDREYIWFIGLPTLFLFWCFINFKIKK